MHSKIRHMQNQHNNPFVTNIFSPPKIAVGNTNRISLPNSDGMPFFLRLRASQIEWLSLRSPRHSPCQLLRWQLRGAEVGGNGTACMALCGLFSPGRACCTVSQPCSPGKVRRVRLDQCACPVAWLLWSVLSVRGKVEQAGRPALFRGFFGETYCTSKCCPFKLLCGEYHSVTLSAE